MSFLLGVQAVASGYLAPGLARRLLWETINLVETSNWACLRTTPTSLTSQEDEDNEARRAVESEFDLAVLQDQTAAVRVQLLNHGLEERAHPPSGPYVPINAVDLSHSQQFSRLLMKRALTFERYCCSHRKCDADFTRVDALIRHERTCHKSKGKTSSAAHTESGAAALRGVDSARGRRRSAEVEDDWLSGISS